MSLPTAIETNLVHEFKVAVFYSRNILSALPKIIEDYGDGALSILETSYDLDSLPLFRDYYVDYYRNLGYTILNAPNALRTRFVKGMSEPGEGVAIRAVNVRYKGYTLGWCATDREADEVIQYLERYSVCREDGVGGRGGVDIETNAQDAPGRDLSSSPRAEGAQRVERKRRSYRCCILNDRTRKKMRDVV